ncbi:DNA-binding response regulator [Alsobacter metallidurans]|uniref:DNA-binding response regulator n=1 Tax=Alsobacter metallidurans TaxID=340221 RepID=A0A917I8E1_9HYPH|nr:response regulator transcription factor [Alsobacter metallidurans]GGH24306.1 DNA-binding response regulator [Alsobacter metallidurans]
MDPGLDDRRISELYCAQSFLAGELGADVLATCSDERQVLMAVMRDRADFAIVNFRRPQARLSTLFDQIRSLDRSIRIVALFKSPTAGQLLAGARSGAAICSMSSDLAELRALLTDEASKRRATLPEPPAITGADGHGDVTRILTTREIEVVRAVARGMVSRAVASQLRISEGTVKVHLSRIYQKIGVHNRTELAHQLRHLLPSPTIER